MSPDAMKSPGYPRTREEALTFDAADPLADLHAAFDLPDGLTYLVGHSLGPPPRCALARLREAAEREWAIDIVGAWNSAGWIDLPSRLGSRIAGLIGVEPDSVVVCDSVSVNLYKLAGALLQSADTRRRIIVEAGEFPTDQYILEQLAETVGAEFRRCDPEQGARLLEQGGILVRSLVDYRTAAIADVADAEAVAQQSGGAVIWDLSHATGVLELSLQDWDVRYAVGCTYKYLNGGPGAPAFLYVAKDVVDALNTPLAGWLGHKRPFAFEDIYIPADGVERFKAGTPPILSMAALDGALDLFDSVAMAGVQAKANALGDMCLAAFDGLGLPSTSPGIGQARGGHVSARHPDGYAVSQVLAVRGVKIDFRAPDTIRFGLSPLILRYAQVWDMLDILGEVLETEAYRDPKYAVQALVT